MQVIINKSLQTSNFPQSWKKPLVKPLIKSLKNGTVDKNYRPVSNLKFFSKLIECAALQQLVHHCKNTIFFHKIKVHIEKDTHVKPC